MGSGPEAGGPLSHAHARVHVPPCALQPAPLLGIFWGLHIPLRGKCSLGLTGEELWLRDV